MGYQTKSVPGHPLADANGMALIHRIVLYEKIGPGSHPCHWCGRTVEWRSYKDRKQAGVLVADHVDGTRQNNEPSNLVPSCFNCNKNRGMVNRKPQTNAVRDDELFIVDKYGWRHRAENRTCEVCGTDFLAELKPSSARRFCSRTCSGVAKRKPIAIPPEEAA